MHDCLEIAHRKQAKRDHVSDEISRSEDQILIAKNAVQYHLT